MDVSQKYRTLVYQQNWCFASPRKSQNKHIILECGIAEQSHKNVVSDTCGETRRKQFRELMNQQDWKAAAAGFLAIETREPGSKPFISHH